MTPIDSMYTSLDAHNPQYTHLHSPADQLMHNILITRATLHKLRFKALVAAIGCTDILANILLSCQDITHRIFVKNCIFSDKYRVRTK